MTKNTEVDPQTAISESDLAIKQGVLDVAQQNAAQFPRVPFIVLHEDEGVVEIVKKPGILLSAKSQPGVDFETPLTPIEDIVQNTSTVFGVEVDAIFSKVRSRPIVAARKMAMTIARDVNKQSYPIIGRLFDRDHTTVLHAVDTTHERLNVDPALQGKYQAIIQRLGTSSVQNAYGVLDFVPCEAVVLRPTDLSVFQVQRLSPSLIEFSNASLPFALIERSGKTDAALWARFGGNALQEVAQLGEDSGHVNQAAYL